MNALSTSKVNKIKEPDRRVLTFFPCFSERGGEAEKHLYFKTVKIWGIAQYKNLFFLSGRDGYKLFRISFISEHERTLCTCHFSFLTTACEQFPGGWCVIRLFLTPFSSPRGSSYLSRKYRKRCICTGFCLQCNKAGLLQNTYKSAVSHCLKRDS